jgi:hypothetical protein
MGKKIIMNQPQAPAGPRILVAPLDWGLGHATRCIPIINTLIRENCSVFLAGEGKVKRLLEKEFPELPFLPLEGYNIVIQPANGPCLSLSAYRPLK